VGSDRARRATEQLLCAVGDPLDAFRDARPDDDDFVDGQCIRVGAAVLSKLPSGLPLIGQAIASIADRKLARTQRMHVQAGMAWLQGDPRRAMQEYSDIVAGDPADLLALRLALSCGFFIGDHAASRDIADSALLAWRPAQPGYGHRLALAAYEHAELGDGSYAEWLGRAALKLDPTCPMAVHALAHALIASGENLDGAAWMREQRAQWAVESRMRAHNAWHLAMFDLDAGRVEAAIPILDGCLLKVSDQSPVDACDAVALCWRLKRAGIELGNRWARLSDAFEASWQPGFWPYVDLHAAIAHGEALETQRLRKLEAAIAACAAHDSFAGRRARRVTLPALGALDAWLAGDRDGAARKLAESPGRLGEAGGSRAQIGAFVGRAP
jgi:hypothetical protein